MNKIIGFIGCGNMAQAMIGGIIKSKIISSDKVIASNPSKEKLLKVSSLYNIAITHNNKEVAQKSDILILSVKPNKYHQVVEEIRDSIKNDVVIVSLAAGISIEYLEKTFEKKVKLIRAMPNISSIVNEGMTVISKNKEINNLDLEDIIRLFEGIGKVELIEEELMDNIPALSASSPAYVFMFIDSLAKGGISSGIPAEKSYRIAAQAVIGAAKLILKDSKDIDNFIRMVCSPGGCTIEAIKELEKNKFKETITSAMKSCTDKVLRLAQQ